MPDMCNGGGQIRARLEFWSKALEELQRAYLELLEGRTQRYRIDDRSLTRLDLETLLKEIREAEEIVAGLNALLEGRKPRKAFGIVPRDW